MAQVAKNGRKVKAIALLFCCFSPTYEKWHKSLKMMDAMDPMDPMDGSIPSI
jgi:hypothetical protein